MILRDDSTGVIVLRHLERAHDSAISPGLDVARVLDNRPLGHERGCLQLRQRRGGEGQAPGHAALSSLDESAIGGGVALVAAEGRAASWRRAFVPISKEMARSMMPDVSFVIPHKGRPDLLRRTLASIAALQRGEHTIEAIVASADSQPPAADGHEGAGVRVLHLPASPSIAAQRNAGAAAAGGTFLAFIDADVALDPDWLTEAIAALLRTPGCVLVAGTQRCPIDATWVERLRCGLASIGADAPIESASGACLLLRRADFVRSGGFPEHLETCEDTYFTQRLDTLGSRWRAGGAGFIHLGEDRDLTTLFQREIWRARSNIRGLASRRVPWREVPSVAIPLAWPVATAGTIGAISAGLERVAAGLGLMTAGTVAAYALRAMRRSPGLTLLQAAAFYVVYFTARSIGTVRGLLSRR